MKSRFIQISHRPIDSRTYITTLQVTELLCMILSYILQCVYYYTAYYYCSHITVHTTVEKTGLRTQNQ